MLKNRIEKDFKSAFTKKERDKDQVDALRLIKSTIQQKEREGSLHELTDAQIIKLLRELSKQKEDTANMYLSAGKQDFANKELKEKSVIDSYLPALLEEDQLRVIIDNIIRMNGYSTIRDMKPIMATLADQYPGQYDDKSIGSLVKSLLGL